MSRDFAWSVIENAIYNLHLARAGGLDAVRTMKSDIDIARADVANVTLITKGRVRWGAADDSFGIEVQAGDTNQHFPDLVGGVLYKVVPLTEDAEFLCITQKRRGRFTAQKFAQGLLGSLLVGGMQTAIIGGGLTDKGEGPIPVEGPNTISFLTPGFGLLLT